MSFTRRPGSEHPRQTSRREDQHIVLNARVQPTAVNPVLSRFNERNMLTNFQFCRSKPGVGIMSIVIDQWTVKTFCGDRLHIKPHTHILKEIYVWNTDARSADHDACDYVYMTYVLLLEAHDNT
ncbi:hypothetical protein TNCV_3989591 [Trichonephila clavipes]|nr:hypothetical protein TNCV_3989591 [Trichonephila clavipes]